MTTIPVDEKLLPNIVKHDLGIYAKETIQSRAFPDLRDGLKPVQRRILYTAYKKGLTHTARYMKSATLAGRVLALHPHGDAAIYGASITISQPWQNNVPLIDVHGSNGGIDGSDAAAPRYTEERLTQAAENLLDDLKQNGADLIPNYDNSTIEPEVLPSRWPVAMINGSMGIGVGFQTNVLPHNPLEIMNAAIYLVQHPKASTEKIQKLVPGPDFPTGGTIIGHEGINDEFSHGHAKITVRGTAKIDHKHHEIIITEIPYGQGTKRLTTEQVINSINKVLEPQRQTLKINRINDSSSEHVDIRIEFKKSAKIKQMQAALNLLYQHSLLQAHVSANEYMIWQRHPVRIGLIEYLKHFLNFRSITINRILNYQKQSKEARLNIVNGLLKLIDIADSVTKTARQSQDRKDFEQDLIKIYKFNPAQAHEIAGMALYRLGHQNQRALVKEQKDLTDKLNDINLVLSSPTNFLKYLQADLRHTRRLFKGMQRKTKIISQEEAKENLKPIKLTNLVKAQDVVVVIKTNDSFQRMSHQVYDNNVHDYDSPDMIRQTLNANTKQGLMSYTNHGQAYFKFVSELPNLNIKQDAPDMHTLIPQYKNNDQTLLSSICDSKTNNIIIAISKSGRIKVTPENKVKPSTSTKRYQKTTETYFKLKNDDQVIWIKTLPQDQIQNYAIKITTTTKRRKNTWKLKDINIQGPKASGRQLIKLNAKNNEKIKDTQLINLNPTPTNPENGQDKSNQKEA